jgi:sugar/nucleoside kinase (ribokinase family)
VVLTEATKNVSLIHVSGTGETGRRNLIQALRTARSAGGIVSFDPNVRLRLWPDDSAVRRAAREIKGVTGIALPSFYDEAQL